MGNPYDMISNEKGAVSVTILDEGGERIPSIDQLPEGYEVRFESSDESVVGVIVRPDGLAADLSSDDIGESTITTTVIKPDGTFLDGTPDDTVITVKNALPGHANVTHSAPEPETPPNPED